MAGLSSGEILSKAVEKISAAVAADRLSASGAENLNRWLTEPQYEKYARRLLELIDGDEFAKLDTLFWEVIRFGTGGRRGLMGELGSATINERTIAESAHGLAVYLKKQNEGSHLRAVVACDTRLRSLEFAKLTATTLAVHGLKVFYFETYRSTPELSFAVRHLNCAAGVMISASHNPPTDNGFKAYWSTGGQVLPPHDEGIIDGVYQAGEIPSVDFKQALADGAIEFVGDEVDRAYVDAVTELSLSTARDVSAVYSPLHGVGETSVSRVLSEAGFTGVEIFEPHRKPDGNFPNVPDQSPNPEHPQIFEPIVACAGQSGADLILASDPDADRLGVCVKDRHGQFVPLSGNRLGALLADYVLRKRTAASSISAEHYVIETLVTTPLIAAIAVAHGVRAIDDLLVGFKYIGQAIDHQGPQKFVFAAEESLGYLAGSYCRDKDAAIAALYILELAAELRNDAKTLLDRLDELYLVHGYFVESQSSEVCKGARGKEQIEGLMQTFREAPPYELAEIPLARVRDYGWHEVRALPDNLKIEELPQPDGDLLFFDSADGKDRFSVAVRPSGTEPKIKFYFFAQAGCDDPDSLGELKTRLDQALRAVQQAFSAWVRNVLE